MSVKIQRATSAPETREKPRGRVVACASPVRRGREFVPFAGEACLTKPFLQKVHAGSIISSRRIFRGNPYEFCQQSSHLVLARLQPREQPLTDVSTATECGTHEPHTREVCASRQAPNWWSSYGCAVHSHRVDTLARLRYG